MTSNQIHVEIPETVIEEVLQKLHDIKTALTPYLQALTADQKRTLFKMGDKTAATVHKVKSYLDTNPDFAPAYMDVAEFIKDEAVVEALSPLHHLATQVVSDLSDTIVLAGSEALVASLLYYGSVKEASARGVAAAHPIYEDLKAQFSKKKHKNTMVDG
jgi:hypothetical protein